MAKTGEKTIIYLIRHGQTAYNNQSLFQGKIDVPLDDIGLMQAEKLSEHLSGVKLDAIYSSDLGRAISTAEAVARGRGLIPQILPAVREIDFGAWESKDFSYINAHFPTEVNMWLNDADILQIPQGESFESASERAYKAVMELKEKHKGQTIAVFTHGGTIRLILCRLLNCSFRNTWHIKQNNCAVNILQFGEKDFHIALMNYNSFLDK